MSNTGTTATNYGNPVDLGHTANNAAFVGAFGGSGSIGANTGTYNNTGLPSTSGVQFSVVVGNDTYTTGTIPNSDLNSTSNTTAPVTVTFTGTNNTTSALEGGSFYAQLTAA